MNLGIGKCTLEYLVSPEFQQRDVPEIDIIFTKYPKLFRDKYDKVMSGKREFRGEIEYSESPDTTLALMSKIQRTQISEFEQSFQNEIETRFVPREDFPEKAMGAYEIVETGTSADVLGLIQGTQPKLTTSIYT